MTRRPCACATIQGRRCNHLPVGCRPKRTMEARPGLPRVAVGSASVRRARLLAPLGPNRSLPTATHASSPQRSPQISPRGRRGKDRVPDCSCGRRVYRVFGSSIIRPPLPYPLSVVSRRRPRNIGSDRGSASDLRVTEKR